MVVLVHTYFRGKQNIVAFLMCYDGLYVSIGNMREFCFHRLPVLVCVESNEVFAL